ncbi:MAG: hypothetical protein F4187_04145, partial [Gemmatimonadetes bacterium]|nr:hypothetical protein [Gemmatimonadota bacterium]
MRQLFERVLVLVPLLALAPATGASAQSYGRAWSQVLDSAFFATNSGDTIYLGKWNIIQPMEPWVLQEWGRKAATTSKWHTNPDCQAAMAYARAALDSADIQAGIGSFAGEYFGPSTDSCSTSDEDVIVVATCVAQMP